MSIVALTTGILLVVLSTSYILASASCVPMMAPTTPSRIRNTSRPLLQQLDSLQEEKNYNSHPLNNLYQSTVILIITRVLIEMNVDLLWPVPFPDPKDKTIG